MTRQHAILLSALFLLSCLLIGCSQAPPHSYQGRWVSPKGSPPVEVIISGTNFPCGGALQFATDSSIPNTILQYEVEWSETDTGLIAAGTSLSPGEQVADVSLVNGELHGHVMLPEDFPLKTKRFRLFGFTRKKPE